MASDVTRLTAHSTRDRERGFMLGLRRRNLITTAAFVACLALAQAPRAAIAGTPDFDSVAWQPLGCPNPDLVKHDSPASADFFGTSAPGTEPAYYAFDDAFLYFRYRLSGDPASGNGFDQFSWTALMQVPMGNRFQYQYQLSLNGKTDTIEVWQNTVASDIDFDPLFHDDSEVKLFAASYTSTAAGNTMPLARSLGDGAGHYFLDFAFPVSVLVANGVIGSSADLQTSFFFPATSTNPSNYNKSYLNCPFQPYTILNIAKSVEPAVLPTNAATALTYTIDVHNAMGLAVGMAISDVPLPAFMTNVAVDVATDDPTATFTVESTNPLLVKFPSLAANRNVTVTISADAMAACNTTDFTNTATVGSANATEKTASALLDVQNSNGVELCDGMDNDCDGQVDEGSDLCDDGNACNGAETCGGAAGCQPGTPVVCVASDACHDAGICNPATGLCTNPPKPDGTTCDDDNLCTQTDTCQTGVCTGDDPVFCTALDQCHDAGVCDPSTGLCSNPAKPDGAACSDANACTDGDACVAGSCVPGSPVVCTAQDQCHDAGTCDPATGSCSNPAKADGATCDDGNACTQSDTCQTGACSGADPVVCTAQDQCHDAGTCDPATGSCSNPAKADGATCDDGNACTQSDTCQTGACTGADPVVCTALDDCHQAGTCDPATGICTNPTEPDGTACGNPGNLCLQTHQCVGGVCTGSNPVVCAPTDQCHDAGECDPETGTCSTPEKPNGTGCDDGNACTQTDLCQAGSCTGGDPVVCTALDQCHAAGSCDPETGACTNPAKPDGSFCDDRHLCTEEACVDGVCLSVPIADCTECTTAADCDDDDECTTDVCSEGLCASLPIENCPSEVCDDGVDNDGDGQVDCADPDCATNPVCKVEICGNCTDDDGDGLVDYEDADCCDDVTALAIKRMTLRTKPQVAKNRLRLKTVYAARAPQGFDPGTQGTRLQLRDADGTFFCQDIPIKNDARWVAKGLFKFKDDTGLMANGLRRARFKVQKNKGDRVLFRTRGKKMQFREPVGNELTVTVAVGNQCTQQVANLRTRKGVKNGRALVFKPATTR
jgi:hypothetical protein